MLVMNTVQRDTNEMLLLRQENSDLWRNAYAYAILPGVRSQVEGADDKTDGFEYIFE